MRPVIYSVACSLDGYIAREDGSYDWIPHDEDHGLEEFFRSVDTALIGRKTHDLMVRVGQPTFPGMTNYVFTRDRRPPKTKGVQWVTEDAVDFVRELRKQNGNKIWLAGGSELAGTFLEAGLVDELRMAVVPILLGSGIPLFPKLTRELPLRLMEEKAFGDGVLRLFYQVRR
jgi:dihydrofolate reductase